MQLGPAERKTVVGVDVCVLVRKYLASLSWGNRLVLGPSLSHTSDTSLFVLDYSLTCPDLSALQGFNSPGMLSLGQMSAWQQHHLGQAALCSLV